MATVRSDWKAIAMGEERSALPYARTFSAAEFLRLCEGVLPEEMEDKWFVFYEEPWLYLHRSWTGLCIFQVRFELRSEAFNVVEALFAGNPEPPEVAYWTDLLDRLLERWAGRPGDWRSQADPRSPFKS
jgi:hypothetical protein